MIAIEMKRPTAPAAELGFHLACDDLTVEKRWLMYPGAVAYSKSYWIEALPLIVAIDRLLGRH